MSGFKWFEFDTETSVWDQLTDLHFAYNQAGIAYTRAMQQFLADDIDHVAFLRQGLRENTHIGRMSQRILRGLKAEEALQLLPEILYAYCHFTSDGDLQQPRDFVLSLPHAAVLDKIEEASEPLLIDGTADQYRRLLELYEQIDGALLQRLAERALRSQDAEVSEAGADYLEDKESASTATITGSEATMHRLWNTPEEDVAWKEL